METTNYGYVTKEWIIENNPLYLERSIFKPIGALSEMNSLIHEQIIRYYRDGRIERKAVYTTEHENVDGITILNAFGTKMFERKRFLEYCNNGGEMNDNCNNICDRQ